MRERPYSSFPVLHGLGITPARAGKTQTSNAIGTARQGSPPLVRERRHTPAPLSIVSGITPARAGKTPASLYRALRGRDHPRSCGKDRSLPSSRPSIWGSPPLVRERRNTFTQFVFSCRITPARAGKTHLRRQGMRLAEDHPRSCGKDFVFIQSRVQGMGSPPLVRERRKGEVM